MHTKTSKGIVDTEENKRMGIGYGGEGKSTAQKKQKKEIIILWTRDEKRRKLSGERNHARHYTGSKKTRQTKDAMDGQHGRMNRMPFEDILKKTRDRIKWSRLVHEA